MWGWTGVYVCVYTWVTSRVDKSCHMWMSHVPYRISSIARKMFWIVNVRLSRCVCVCVYLSHVTCEYVMSHMNESCHIWMSHVTYGMRRLACHVWHSGIYTCIPVSVRYTCNFMWIRHVTYEWVMSHMEWDDLLENVTNASYEADKVCIYVCTYMSHVTCESAMSHVNESCHTWKG